MIARMKHFISFLIFAICACCFLTPSAPVKTASAETLSEVYAVAPTSDVWFYSEPLDNKGLFILPESYYVRILNDSDPFCQVQYLNKTGYCKRSDLLFVDFVPARPFLLYDYTLSYSMETVRPSATVFSTVSNERFRITAPSFTGPKPIITSVQTACTTTFPKHRKSYTNTIPTTLPLPPRIITATTANPPKAANFQASKLP